VAAHETLGLLLVRDGVISRPQLYDALRLQRQNNRLLGTCLLALGYLQPQTLLQILARQLSIPALPPGTLGRASPMAVARVPAEMAVRLRIVPFSWDGEMLGVAVADGRALNYLHEVAVQAQAAVGAYVALEMEIEAVLRTVYPEASLLREARDATQTSGVELNGRPRPVRAEPQHEIPTRNFGAALGLEEQPPGRPAASVIQGAPPRAPIHAPPPPAKPPTAPVAPAERAIVRDGFYDAVENIYQAANPHEVGVLMGQALLNYFSKVLILDVNSDCLEVCGFGGMATPPPASIPLTHVPKIAATLNKRAIAYGPAESDNRTTEFYSQFKLPAAATSLIAPVVDGGKVELLVYADNGAVAELYEDLHDVELLFKEAETALPIIRGG